MPLPLKDKWIVITRPQHQAEKLRLLLEAAGAKIVLFPLLEIQLPDKIALVERQFTSIEDYDLAIFTSANAVSYSLKWLDKSKLETIKIAAIGKKTAKLLEVNRIHVDYFPPQGFNSEMFLAMPEIQSYKTGKRIVILRGQNGREFLKTGLEKQGARVEYFDVYKRTYPQKNLQQLAQYDKKNQLDMILITSGTSLMNLFKFSSDNTWLKRANLLVGSERIKTQLLNSYDYQGDLLNTSDPSDEAIYKKLLEWGAGTNTNG